MDDGKGYGNREEIFSKAVRAGKRTYFFDVKATKGNDYYLTITESKRRYDDDGKFFYEKHKLFLYKEDFDKFAEGLGEAVSKIEQLRGQSDPTPPPSQNHSSSSPSEDASSGEYSSDISFDDLGE